MKFPFTDHFFINPCYTRLACVAGVERERKREEKKGGGLGKEEY